MAYVEENKVYNTVYGKLKNNNKMNQIQRENKALFQFSISEVTVDDGVLVVVCDAVTGETINYTLDLDDANAELTPELYNLSTGGSLQMFLALVWRLYTSTLDSTGEQVDSMSIEQLQDRIKELTEEVGDLTQKSWEVRYDISEFIIEEPFITSSHISYSNNQLSGIPSIHCDVPLDLPEGVNRLALDHAFTYAFDSKLTINGIELENEFSVPPAIITNKGILQGTNIKVTSTQISERFEEVPDDTTPLEVTISLTNKQTGATITVTGTYDPTTEEWTNGGGQVINTTPTSVGFDVDGEVPMGDNLQLVMITLYDKVGKKPISNEIVEVEVVFQDGTTYNTRLITQPFDDTDLFIPSDVLVVGEAEITMSYMGNEQYSPSSFTTTTLITEE